MLNAFTGHEEAYWFNRIQDLIARNTTRARGQKHGRTNASAWVRTLTSEVRASFPKGEQFDGNMRLAVCLALILTHWYSRIHHAKIMDLRRPLAIRREVYPRWLAVSSELQRLFFDERLDDIILEGMPWNNPFWPHARGGNFV